jgi:uncharacterized protein YcbK (DUF882 family)
VARPDVSQGGNLKSGRQSPHIGKVQQVQGIMTDHPDRRKFLALGGAALGGAALTFAVGRPALAAPLPATRSLSFYNLHTGESLKTTYCVDGTCVPDALDEINHVLRDFRTGDVHEIDVRLLDLLAQIRTKAETNKPFHVISGYRSPKTNNMLRQNSSGVAKRSLHMVGEAIDIRIPGRDLSWLRQTALDLKRGGVGYYPKSDFVHVDVGRVRQWAG